MESKSTFLILIIVVSVLALALAILVGYLFFIQGASNDKAETVAVSSTAVIEIPKEEELITIALYDDKRTFNLKNNDPETTSMMQANVTLKCYKTLKQNKKVIVEEKVAAYSEEIQELVVRFFLTKTIDDVKNIEVMDNAKEDLSKQINELLNEGEKKPENIVYKVIFSQWIYQ